MSPIRGVCSRCGRPIKWIRTQNRKQMPVDFEPVPYWENKNGKGVIITVNGGTMRCDLQGQPNRETGFGYMTHFATCPGVRKQAI